MLSIIVYLIGLVGKIVFGWNKYQKNNINLGKTTNQKFVQIPTGRLKERIKQLCELYGIEYIETEESYTSKASFVDRDFLPTIGEKLQVNELKEDFTVQEKITG